MRQTKNWSAKNRIKDEQDKYNCLKPRLRAIENVKNLVTWSIDLNEVPVYEMVDYSSNSLNLFDAP